MTMSLSDFPASDADSPASASSATRDTGAARRTSWSWVPIRSLGPRHRGRILAHLLALEERARYLRFGFPASDSQLSGYVDRIDFDRDEVFGVFNRRLDLIAMAHLAHPESSSVSDGRSMSEFGVSVLARARRRGFGQRLFEHAMLHARNRGVRAMFIHALSENAPMLKIARDAGATVHREGSESEAWLELPPGSFASQIDEMLGTQAAEIDYRIKEHARHVGELMGWREEDFPVTKEPSRDDDA